MSFGELLAAILGWLGEFIRFLTSFVPRFRIVRRNQKGVRYLRGEEPTEVPCGIAWYWPWCTDIVIHFTCRQVLLVPAITVETKDSVRLAIGVAITYRITNVLKYEVENFNSDENMAEVAMAGVRDIVTSHTLSELTSGAQDDSRLGGKLARRMGKDLEPLGVEVLACRPTDQVRVDRTFRLFGVDLKQISDALMVRASDRQSDSQLIS